MFFFKYNYPLSPVLVPQMYISHLMLKKGDAVHSYRCALGPFMCARTIPFVATQTSLIPPC